MGTSDQHFITQTLLWVETVSCGIYSLGAVGLLEVLFSLASHMSREVPKTI